MDVKLSFVEISWTISRAEASAGYNICRADIAGKRYQTTGGGYDMVGTVIGDWLADTYNERLVANYKRIRALSGVDLYNNVLTIDGGCGIDAVKTIAQEIGIRLKAVYNLRRTFGPTGFIVADFGASASARVRALHAELGP